MAWRDWERAIDAGATTEGMAEWLYESGIAKPEDMRAAHIDWNRAGHGVLEIDTDRYTITHNFKTEGWGPSQMPDWVFEDLWFLLDAYEIELDVETSPKAGDGGQ